MTYDLIVLAGVNLSSTLLRPTLLRLDLARLSLVVRYPFTVANVEIGKTWCMAFYSNFVDRDYAIIAYFAILVSRTFWTWGGTLLEAY